MTVVVRHWPDLDPLLAAADDLAARWGSRVASATTPAVERAILRLFGVEGLDRSGHPLAAAVLDRALAGDPSRLASGIALPFAVALLEYETGPEDLALDIAAGNVDLTLEAELLRDPGRRAAVEVLARRLGSAALARIDANRLARRDLREILGDADRPWVGLELEEPAIDQARPEAVRRIAAGADVIRVRVPAVRELVDRLLDVGMEPPESWRPREGEAGPVPRDPIPAGAQRALAVLRASIDEAAAERGRYARLMTVTSPLAAPEQAAVAAFERVDIVEADPIAEIVDGGVDPERVLADHAFAHRLHRRAGTRVVIGAGPLVVGPELARGVPSDPATRNGRGFALQLIGIALARRNGLLPARLLAGALPAWLTSEADAETQAFAQVALRREAFPDLGLAFVEPQTDEGSSLRWPFALTSGLIAAADRAALAVRLSAPRATTSTATATRSAARLAAQLARVSGASDPRGLALEQIVATADIASSTLRVLTEQGWSALLDAAPGVTGLRQSSRESVVERTESFDPFEDD